MASETAPEPGDPVGSDSPIASSPIQSISAVTLAVRDMSVSVAFYDALGFSLLFGGADSEFTSYGVASGFVNLQFDSQWAPGDRVWGRVIFWVDDVDAMYERAVSSGHTPSMEPSDAPWGERYFHLLDPDGHELSFARPLTD